MKEKEKKLIQELNETIAIMQKEAKKVIQRKKAEQERLKMTKV